MGCGSHSRKRPASINVTSGLWHCHACGEGGHLRQFLDGAPEPVAACSAPKEASTGLVDLLAVDEALRAHQPTLRAYIVDYCQRRGWPVEVARQAAHEPDVVWCPEAGKVSGALAGFATMWRRHRLLVKLRGLTGEIARFKGRDASRRRGLKSKSQGNDTSGASGQLVLYGHLPRAAAAAAAGDTVYLVEGEIDWLALRSWLRAHQTSPDGVLGADTHATLPRIAEALRDRLLALGAQAPTVVIIPHIGDHIAKGATVGVGEASAAEAAHMLSSVANVRIARCAPHGGKADLADVLEKEGVEGLRRVLVDAETLCDRRDLDVLRDQLRERWPAARGKALIMAGCGVGKTELAIELGLQHVRDGLRVVIAAPTRSLAHDLMGRITEFLNSTAAASLYVSHLSHFMFLGRSADNCPEAVLAAAAARVEPGGAARICRGHECDYQRTVRALEALPHASIIVTTHAALAGAWFDAGEGLDSRLRQAFADADGIIWDESTQDAAIQHIELSLDHFNAMVRMGILDGAGGLREVIEATNGLRSSADAGVIAAAAAGLLVGQPQNDVVAGVMRELEADGRAATDAAIIGRLDLLPDWTAARAIQDAQERGWTGCYVYKRNLYVPRMRALPRGQRFTWYLDATSSPARARALAGADVEVVHVPSPMPLSVEVIQVRDCDTSKSGLESPGHHTRWAMAHELLDGERTLHVTHKACADELRDLVQGPVIHHGSPEARGDDRYRFNFDTVVLDGWHLPDAVIQAQAECWTMLGAQAGVEADWREEAIQAGVVSAVHQAAGRIGLHQGNRRVVILDERALGFAPSRVESADVWAWRAGLGVRGDAPLLAALEAVLRLRGVWAPSGQGDPHSPGVYLGNLGVTLSEPVSIGLAEALLADPATRKRVERLGGWAGVARLLGARCAFIQTDRGQPCAVLSSGPVTVEGLRVAFAGSGVRWFEVFGQRVELGQPRLGGAIEGLRAEGRAVTVEALCSVLGVTDRTLRRYARAEGLVLAEVLDAPSAAPAPPLVEVAAAAEVSVVDPVSPPPGVPPAAATVELPVPVAVPAAVPFAVPAAVLGVRRLDDGVEVPEVIPAHLRAVWALVAGDGAPGSGRGLLASALLDGQDRHHRGALGWLVHWLWSQDELPEGTGPTSVQLEVLLRRLPLVERRRLILSRWSQWNGHAAWGDAPAPWCWVELAQRGVPQAVALATIEGAHIEVA